MTFFMLPLLEAFCACTTPVATAMIRAITPNTISDFLISFSSVCFSAGTFTSLGQSATLIHHGPLIAGKSSPPDEIRSAHAEFSSLPCRTLRNLPEAGAAEFLPKVFPLQFDNAAHFVQPRPHTLADPVAQVLLSCGRPWASDCARRPIVEIRSYDRGAIVVIASIQDQADCIPNPLCGLHRSQLIQHQHFR